MRRSSKLLILSILIFHSVSGIALAAENSAKSLNICPNMGPWACFLALFAICFCIGVIAVFAGVGGGVIFTPIFMGFTQIDSYIIRSTGLLVAMAGALVAARPFLRAGIANMRLLYTGAVPYTISALAGALLAGYIEKHMEAAGEVFLQGGLGLLIIGIGCLFLFSGKKTEYPIVKKIDRLTQGFDLSMSYYEKSLDKKIHYDVTRVGPGLILFCLVGLISGLFGLGAGWAMVPVFNMVMLTPLKVAAACSKVMISIGDSAAIWPYIKGGGLIPVFAVPCMIGLITGTMAGTRLMLRTKATYVRWIIIAVMFLTGTRLLIKGISLAKGLL